MSLVDRYTLEANFGQFFGVPIWYDISSWVDGTVQVSRGRANEQSTPSPGVLSATLVNDDGRLTPGLATSPYYPYVVDGAPIRLTCRVPTGDNYEDNSSHEAGIGEWSVGGFGTQPTVALSQTHVFGDGGQWAMLATWPAGTSFATTHRTMPGLAVGQQYTWSRWVWVPAGSPAVQLIVVTPVGGVFAVVASGAASAANDAFTRISVTFVAQTTSHILQLAPTTTAGGTVWTDAGNLTTGASPGSTLAAATLLRRWYGYALEWQTQWQGPAALAATTQLVAVDVLTRLGRKQVRPFDVEEALLDSPQTYLPLDEPETATQAGNMGAIPGAGALVNPGGGGTAAFGAGTGPPADGTSSLVLTRASATSGWYVRVPTVLFNVAITVEAFIATSTVSTTILDLGYQPTGGVAAGAGMTLSIDAAGKLQWRSDAASLTVTSPASVADGQTHHVAATYVHTGTNHVATLFVDGAQVNSGSLASTWQLIGASWLTVGGGSKLPLFNGTVNHVGVYITALSGARLLAHRNAGVTGFGGEASDLRVSRLAAYAGLSSLTAAARSGVGIWDDAALGLWDSTMIWAASDLALEPGTAMIYGQSAGGFDALSGMNDVAATEGGVLLADRAGQLQLQNRQHRYNRPASVVLDSANADPALTPAYDDQGVTNSVTATTQDGAVVQFVDPVSAGSPPAGRGVYDASASLLTRDPADAYAYASWRVNRYGVPRPAYRQVMFDLQTLPDATAAALLAVDVGDRLDLTGLPPQAPASSAALIAEGYTEAVGAEQHTITFLTTDATLSAVMVWDSPTLAVWDSARWAW